MKHVKQLYPVLVLLMLAALALAACGAPPAPAAPTAGPEQATSAPQAAPTQQAQPQQPTAQPQTAPSTAQQLTGKVWQWTKTAYNDGKTITVSTPANYTIEFMADGTLAIKADCNNVTGTYTADGGNLTIKLGASTMAMCPPGSLDSEYLKQLNEVAQYLLQGETLVLNFKLDTGGMTFTPASAQSAQPGQPAQPGTVPGQDLGGKQWQWVNTVTSNGQTTGPSNSADYTIEFSMVDGRVNIKADCNNATGEFMTDGQSLQIMIGGVTRAMCPEGSLSDEFLKELSEVSSYTVQGDALTMKTASGTMTLSAGQAAAQQPAATPAPAAPATLQGPTWNWVKTEYSNGTTITSPDPAKFTVTFQPSDHFGFTADCNNGSGSYTLDGPNLTMQVEGMTLAFCPLPNGDFTQMLNQVASYKIEGNTLFLAFKVDGGIMTFTTGGAQPAPSTSSPTTPSTSSGSNAQRLTTGVWKWQQSADSSGQTWNSPNPANYTLQFNSDGTVAAQVDCNRSLGTYKADETSLTITMGPTTMMACPPPTMDAEFQRQLSLVSSYFFDGNDLVLLWKFDSGSMKFNQ